MKTAIGNILSEYCYLLRALNSRVYGAFTEGLSKQAVLGYQQQLCQYVFINQMSWKNPRFRQRTGRVQVISRYCLTQTMNLPASLSWSCQPPELYRLFSMAFPSLLSFKAIIRKETSQQLVLVCGLPRSWQLGSERQREGAWGRSSSWACAHGSGCLRDPHCIF